MAAVVWAVAGSAVVDWEAVARAAEATAAAAMGAVGWAVVGLAVAGWEAAVRAVVAGAVVVTAEEEGGGRLGSGEAEEGSEVEEN